MDEPLSIKNQILCHKLTRFQYQNDAHCGKWRYRECWMVAQLPCHFAITSVCQRVRDGCTACMIDCYRDDSVMQHVGVAVSDGVQAAAQGHLKQAWKHWFNQKNLVSLKAVWEEAPWLRRL